MYKEPLISESVILEAARRLVERFHPQRIILFGSQARGGANEKSDYDFLVICRLDRKRRHLMVEMDRAMSGLGIARDIVVLTPEEYERDRHIPGTVARPASLEGRVLYDHAG